MVCHHPLPFYGRENDDEPWDFGKTPLLDKPLPVISHLKHHLSGITP
jgi:hypothetical protein